MKKNLLIFAVALLYTQIVGAAVRNQNTISRQNSDTINSTRTESRTTDVASVSRGAVQSNSARNATVASTTTQSRTNSAQSVTSRSATQNNVVNRNASANAAVLTIAPITSRTASTTISNRNVNSARNATTINSVSDTAAGAAYEQCKTAYFRCMDQFCELKNDTYRRCSCSDRVYDFEDMQAALLQAEDELTLFVENLDAVGLTAEQAIAMKTSTAGEDALTGDSSDSNELLQAILNSITDDGASDLGGRFSDLNTIDISFDTANAFGIKDTGLVIASYNGENLYSAVYPQCRDAVAEDCNQSNLQRAVTAYLMEIEQDCNSVETAIENNQKKLTKTVTEGGALLNLARVENRQNLNSDDMATCLTNVELAILDDEVCGAGYKKCLDNGEFIDVSTGEPIAGVVQFYELAEILTFADGDDIASQQLSTISENRLFVQNFENRVKKFAEPALNKCVENSEQVWEDYLDKAMIDIFYAQKSKVDEIKNNCFAFIDDCYTNTDGMLDDALAGLSDENTTVLTPDKINLTSAICRDYVESCDNMFDNNILEMYVNNINDTDTISACRAVAKQCFDEYGGVGYQNFYYPFSGLFGSGRAMDWFTLESHTTTTDGTIITEYQSECARQLHSIDSCSDPETMMQVFGGFDKFDDETTSEYFYGLQDDAGEWQEYQIRNTGVASEVYSQIVDTLKTQCDTLSGEFVESKYIKYDMYNEDNLCKSNFTHDDAGLGSYVNLAALYGVVSGEDMCPRDYNYTVDVKSWGVCSCWENGARRSQNGTSVTCMPSIPIAFSRVANANCSASDTLFTDNPLNNGQMPGTNNWCTQTTISELNQVCPLKSIGTTADGLCLFNVNEENTGSSYEIEVSLIPEGNL